MSFPPRSVMLLTAAAVCFNPTDAALAQVQLDPRQGAEVDVVKPPGALPRIDRVTPVGPDGVPSMRPGEPFVIHGAYFSSIPGRSRIGIRTWASESAAIPPQQPDFIASIDPTSAGSNRLEAVAPTGLATGRYLVWVYVEGVGHSSPLEFHYSNPQAASGHDPTISLVKPGYPGLETVVRGSNFSKGAMVQWPIGLAQVATFIDASTLKTRVPKGLQPGWHQVRVEANGRWSNAVAVQVVEPKPLNLHWDQTDRNGIPLNPRWGWQLTHQYGTPGYYPKPTSWLDRRGPLGVEMDWSRGTDQALSYDTGWFGCGPHVNWRDIPVTFSGFWMWSHKSPWAEDDDCNFYFFPPEGVGATDRGQRNPGGIMTEFDSGNTIDHFHTPWWSEFRDAVDDESIRADRMASVKYGIVTGRWGLDCAHDCYAEIHPVWAMALLARDDPHRDLWAMFVRPWGDQGFCGSKTHILRLPMVNGHEVYTFELPWRKGAESVIATDNFLCRTSCSLSVTKIPGKAVLVSLSYPAGTDKPRINGQLQLDWRYPQGASPGHYEFPKTALANVSAAMGRPFDPSNREYWDAMAALSDTQRQAINQRMQTVAKPPPTLDQVAARVDPSHAAVVDVASIPQVATLADQHKAVRMHDIDTFARTIGVTTVLGSDARAIAPPDSVSDAPPSPARVSEPGLIELEAMPTLDAHAVSIEPGTNRPGHDYRSFELDHPEPELCREACAADGRCRAFTYVNPGVQGERAMCWLKSHASSPEPAPCCVSGAKSEHP